MNSLMSDIQFNFFEHVGKTHIFYESQWVLINYNTMTMSLGRQIIRGNVHKA